MAKLKSARNKNATRREAPILHTVWLETTDGKLVGWAATDNERKRMEARAKRNAEDMPVNRSAGLLHRIIHAIEDVLDDKF